MERQKAEGNQQGFPLDDPVFDRRLPDPVIQPRGHAECREGPDRRRRESCVVGEEIRQVHHPDGTSPTVSG